MEVEELQGGSEEGVLGNGKTDGVELDVDVERLRGCTRGGGVEHVPEQPML